MRDRRVALGSSPTERPIAGLSADDVRLRQEAGQGNRVEQHTARSIKSIIRANTLTRFNAIITCLTVTVLVFGDPIDAVFGLVMVLNSVIGIVQEIRAKRSLDAIQVLLVPSIGVHRDQELVRLSPDDLVLGDVIELEAGDQVPVDGVVLRSHGLEVDESALTGESRPVAKSSGSEVLSGSVAVAGSATAEATRVGESSWAHKLTSEAKHFVLTQSELRVGIDRLLTVVSWILVPLSALLVWSQLRNSASLAEGLVSAVAGVVALVPQGLVLLVSMTFAIAVVRLARENVVVQELPAVEGLARVDVLCVDKTGTLTTGRLVVESIDAIGIREAELLGGLSALAALETARNSTMEALRPLLSSERSNWTAESYIAFSSVRKWSGATFAEHRTWILGAPEILLESMEADGTEAVGARVDELTGQARRVLMVARGEDPCGPDEQLPPGIRPVGLVVLKEEVRPDAARTLEYFGRQGVEVKVVSGDNPRTVAAVAAELGIAGADNYVDLHTCESLETISPDTTIFGRVLPEQKRELVHLLQQRGHTVAMTGDGVNDIPSLKAADIGIAMDTATSATKAVAQLVLLDGKFDRLPRVVDEGRRVIANMERVSSLFVTKTVYAAVLALMVGAAGTSFPFLPRHLSLIGTLTIGIPGFVLSFSKSNERCRPGYLRRVLRFSIPAGLVAAGATLAAYSMARSSFGGADLEQARTSATMTLTLIGIWILYRLIRPLDRIEAGLLAALTGATALALIPSPWSDFYELSLPNPRTVLVLLGMLAAMIAVLQFALTIRDHKRH